MKFEKGKQVQLISGGPIMTMESEYPQSGTAICVWFVDSKVMRDEFGLETLREYHERSHEPEDD